jgi:hypothetical protein
MGSIQHCSIISQQIVAFSGRVARSSPKSTPSTNAAAQSRVSRRNTAKQTQIRKRQALIASTRIFNSVDGAPRIAAVVPLCSDVYSRDAVNALAGSLDGDVGECPQSGIYRLKYSLRSRYSIKCLNITFLQSRALQDVTTIHSITIPIPLRHFRRMQSCGLCCLRFVRYP